MIRRRLVLFVLLGFLATPALAQTKAVSPPKPKPLEGLAEYIEHMRQDWKVPGLAIAIVKNDSVVLMRGFGVREMGKPEPIDEHTIFAIASCSKAFTATLIGMLADEHKLDWDEPATLHLPGFQLYDPYASRELTIRDLLSHRSGLSRGDLSWYESANDRAEVIRKIRFLKPTSSFRSQYGYQNVMFSTAGEIVGKWTAGRGRKRCAIGSFCHSACWRLRRVSPRSKASPTSRRLTPSSKTHCR